MNSRRAEILIVVWSLLLVRASYAGEDPPAASDRIDAATIQQLKNLLMKQQQQIDSLREALEEQKKMLERVAASAPSAVPPAVNAGLPRSTPPDQLVASTTPMVVPSPPATATPAPVRVPLPQQPATTSAPLQIHIGNVAITPVGFMDLTATWKDRNAGGSLGTNFGSIPYNTTFNWQLGEFRFSPQNSRLGFRVDGDWKDTHFIAYNEFDFLGTSGAFNVSVTNGAFVPRLRLFWVDVRNHKYEFLAGQSWSMLTPNRKGISALPSDLFYSQVIDVNYIIGLPWTRQPGMRFIYHPTDKVALGFSAENPDQYIGGSGGGPTITLPAAPSPLNGLGGTQLDNSTNVQTIPNLHPDFIAKAAFDPNSRVHFEFTGIQRTFRIWNQATNTHFTKPAGGGGVNGNFEFVKNVRFITNNLWGRGIGRYFFGDAPDLIVRANGEISPILSGGWNDGFEAVHGNTLLYAYYSGIYVRRNTALDANGTSLIGYGYRGSPNSQNRTIQEATFGFNQTIWKDPKYGAINVMGQYAYFLRNPWYIAPNLPKATHLNTIFFNIRYTLPGAPPPAR